MRNKHKFILGVALSTLLLVTVPISAQENSGSDEAELAVIIEAVRNGWLQADGTPFRQYFLDFPGARYVESGGQNSGLSDLINHHVEPEAGSFEEFDYSFDNIEIHVEGQFAWAVVDTEINIVLKDDGRKIHNTGYETLLFRKIDGEWKVIHTHSSSRPVKK